MAEDTMRLITGFFPQDTVRGGDSALNINNSATHCTCRLKLKSNGERRQGGKGDMSSVDLKVLPRCLYVDMATKHFDSMSLA